MASPLCYNGKTALHFIALHCIALVVELLQLQTLVILFGRLERFFKISFSLLVCLIDCLLFICVVYKL